ncbi:GerAB/ArcD/ProY family transporter [Alkalihalobacillus sp. CinArs1]|uniref:GerAB/ArcD/ProY family transporter n=1 Tax=Alkalihalobacillus sp. CinArs1 TaxID=2995314 RepID=UPI0022DCEC46|nr:GerAB/ArcD/ProY family transporter [Alkalihalobacillus sp. CinArs1]
MSEKIAPFHLAILIYMIQSGVTLTKLPRLLAVDFGTNGWIMVILVSFVACCNIFLIGLVNRIGGGKDLFDIMEALIPRGVMAPFYLLLAFIYSVLVILIGKDYVVITQVLSFQNTNAYYFIIIMLLLVIYLVSKDVYTITKVTAVFFVFTVWMTLLIFYHIPYMSFTRMTPFFLAEGENFLLGFINLFTAFLGFEIVVFLFPYIDRSKKNWFRSVYIGNMITTFIYLVISIVSYMFFSLEQLKLTSFPVLNLIAFIEIELIERIESFIFTLFLMKIVVSIVMYIWVAKLLFKRALPVVPDKWVTLILIFSGLAITFNANLEYEIGEWLNIFGLIGASIAIALPLIMLTVLGILKIRRRNRA